MKKFFPVWIALFCLIGASMAQNQEDVLLTINGKPVYTGEFVRLISKNQGASGMEKPDLKESLDVFINFKLKVKEASAMGLDTARQFKDEMASYRTQLGRPYLLDQEVTEDLVREAYERSLWEIRASHILIGVAMDAPPSDTLLAYQKAMQLREQLIKGAPFETIARESSDDPTAAENGGDLGYFSVFQMVYPFENAVYQTPVNGISEPVRTNFGYHILKVTDKRPNRGKVQVAQIWKSTNLMMTDEEREKVKAEAYQIWEQLKNGADFADLANKQSDDRSSGPRGGIIPQWFGTGGMHPDFVEASFALENIGDFSEPVFTNMGYHIIRLVNKRPPESFEVQHPALLKSVKNSDRAQKSESTVVEKLKKEYNYKVNESALEDFYRMVDPSIFEGRWDANPALQKKDVLFTLNNINVLQSDFARFLALNMRQSKATTIAEYVDQKFEAFSRAKILEYEESRLEQKYPEFRYLMQEFYDGNLIFEVSNRKIWSMAGADTVGLNNFYQSNTGKYMWPERIDLTTIRLKGLDENDKRIKDLRKLAEEWGKAGETEDQLRGKLAEALKDSQGISFEVSTSTAAKGDLWVVDQIKWKKGLTETLNDGSSTIIGWISAVHPPKPKSLDEIRGLVTADYQDYLEKEWIKELRQKYTVKVNEDVLAKIKL